MEMSAAVQTIGKAAAATVVLAHQGGWDEMLMVAVPIAVFALLLYVANNRASKLGNPDSGSPQAPGRSGPAGTSREPADKSPASAAKTKSRPKNPRGGPI